MGNTYYSNPRTSARLGAGLADYDRDTIAYLAAQGVDDALLERVAGSLPHDTVETPSSPQEPVAHRPADVRLRLAQVCTLEPGMLVRDAKVFPTTTTVKRTVALGMPPSGPYEVEFDIGLKRTLMGTDFVKVLGGHLDTRL